MINMALPSPYLQYQQQQAYTSPQDKLLLMLYDGAIKFCHQAKRAIQNKQTEDAHHYILKAEKIIEEFMITLDMRYEVAHKLYALYEYMYRRLVEANVKKDTEIIDEVLDYLSDLRKTWAEASVKANKERMV